MYLISLDFQSPLNNFTMHEVPEVFLCLTDCLFWKVLFFPPNSKVWLAKVILFCRDVNPFLQITTQLLRAGKLKECPILDWITSTSSFHQHFPVFPFYIPEAETLSSSVSVFTLMFLIFHAACWDSLKKEPKITTGITTILNFELKFIHLAPVIPEFEPNLTPPLFWRRFAITLLFHMPVWLQIRFLCTAAFQMH